MRYEDLPSLIRGRCVDLGITQSRLRELLARNGFTVSKNTISKWATGAGKPGPEHLEALLDVLSVHGGQRRAIIYRLTYAPDDSLDVLTVKLTQGSGNREDAA